LNLDIGVPVGLSKRTDDIRRCNGDVWPWLRPLPFQP
jgi:hypothetical protein